jgi:hypothetical protein
MKFAKRVILGAPLFVACSLLSGCGDSPIGNDDTPKSKAATKPSETANPSTQDSAPTDGDSKPQADTAGTLRCDLEFKKAELCAQMTWVKGPEWNSNTEDPMEVRLEFWNPKTKERADLNYEVEFDSAMPTMNNHPLASKPRVNRENNPVGVYSVSDIRISCLGGNWHFFFQLKEQGSIIDQVRYIWVRDEHLIN